MRHWPSSSGGDPSSPTSSNNHFCHEDEFDRVFAPFTFPDLSKSSSTTSSFSSCSSTNSTQGNQFNPLYMLIQEDLEPDGSRIILPLLTTRDRLSLSTCSRALLRYRSHLSRVKIVAHPRATPELERGLVALLAGQESMSYLCVGHEPVLRLVLEAIRWSGGRGLRSLDLSGIRAKDSDTELVGATLAEGACRALQDLILGLRWDNSSAAGVGDVLRALSQGACPGLRKLELQSTSFYVNKGGEQIAAALISGHCQSLRELDLYGIQIGDQGVAAIAGALRSGCCPNLRAINLADCAIRAHGGVVLAQALRGGVCPKLQTLNLSNNFLLGDEGVGRIVEALPSLPMLRKLELSYVCMGPIAGLSLARVLARGSCPLLQHINLSFNRGVGDDVLGEIIRAIGGPTGSPGLQRLELRKAGLGHNAANALIEVLSARAWPSLRQLDISGADRGTDSSVSRIIKALAAGAHTKLKYLRLSYSYHPSGDLPVLEAIRQDAWPNLEALRISSLNLVLGDTITTGLAEALGNGAGRKLRVLAIQGMCDEGGRRLVESLTNGACPMLEELEVDYIRGVDWRGAISDRRRVVKVTVW